MGKKHLKVWHKSSPIPQIQPQQIDDGEILQLLQPLIMTTAYVKGAVEGVPWIQVANGHCPGP